jgi:hypothetical protein
MTSCESCLDYNRKFCFCILLDLSTFVLAGLDCSRRSDLVFVFFGVSVTMSFLA